MSELSGMYYLLSRKTYKNMTLLNIKSNSWDFGTLMNNIEILDNFKKMTNDNISLDNPISLFNRKRFRVEVNDVGRNADKPTYFLIDEITGISQRLNIMMKFQVYTPKTGQDRVKQTKSFKVEYDDVESVRIKRSSQRPITAFNSELDELSERSRASSARTDNSKLSKEQDSIEIETMCNVQINAKVIERYRLICLEILEIKQIKEIGELCRVLTIDGLFDWIEKSKTFQHNWKEFCTYCPPQLLVKFKELFKKHEVQIFKTYGDERISSLFSVVLFSEVESNWPLELLPRLSVCP
ncbi:uncharacterized protein LOC122502702 [Leptopilina heterotoma]|uniref:uncharacterized protein LOC122502702 n=1 Tax=Leptopilina heterotoma TaxID=63436 RepID=UPI001CA7D957|nr:uncharacterized protein LOC122502702 [Leptopilina heterotoma]